MMNIKKAVTVMIAASGLAVAGAGAASAHGGDARGLAKDSPGVVAGNTTQLPVSVPLNLCGNTTNVVGIGNVAKDNDCKNV
ncbi:chaplin [Streptomyces sp. NPDC003077]|uniref:chaplin n=1 Tax=Streptomyces sp. NPDC003077 TaxID=3154443 RepID=UPI0033B8871E